MRISMGLCFVIVLTSLTRAGAQGPQSAPQPAPPKHPTMENHISIGQLTPTPDMWFHEQAMRERSDPRAMVRQKAEFDTVQRQRRMAARAWYGVSAGRPAANITPLLAQYDTICDGTDTAATRYLLADACHLAGKTLVSAAAIRFEGQLAVFRPGTPCYRCLYPQPAPADLAPSCAEAGVLGTVTGVIGALAATEVIKLALQLGETLAGKLLLWDALEVRFRTIVLQRDPACALCGDTPSIHDLRGH